MIALQQRSERVVPKAPNVLPSRVHGDLVGRDLGGVGVDYFWRFLVVVGLIISYKYAFKLGPALLSGVCQSSEACSGRIEPSR